MKRVSFVGSLLPAAFFFFLPFPFFVNEASSFLLKRWGEGPASEAGRALGVGAGAQLKEFS